LLACPLTEATRQVVSREVLDALKNKRILGAGLDVFEHEPTDPKLWADLSNVVLTPHVAGRTSESVQEAIRAAIGNLIRVYQGQPLENRVV
jgi:phosphoglycerate dehydrogenase-like enzyme